MPPLLLTAPILGRSYLRAVVFFPVLVSTIGVGLTFQVLLTRSTGWSTRRSPSSASTDPAG